jgi:DNA primase large subunit
MDNTDPAYKGAHYSSPKTISFYDEPPQDVIGIHEFQHIAVSRLQVLKKIQFLYDQNKEGMHEIMAQEINTYSKQHNLNVEGNYDSVKRVFTKAKQSDMFEAGKNDNISHFICRLAYCRNDDLRRWFAT